APEGPVDESALITRLEDAGRQNTEIESRRTKRQNAAVEVRRLLLQAEEIDGRCEKLRAELESLVAEAQLIREKAAEDEKQLAALPPLPSTIDTAEIRNACAGARQQNKTFEEYETAKKAKARLGEQAETVEQQASALTQAMEARKKQKADAIAAAKLPIDGIGFGDGVVLLNGIPFDQ